MNNISEKTWEKIKTFLEKHPLAEYGPTHLVLSDGNVDNSSLDIAIRDTESVLEFLRELRSIPEAER